MEFIPNKNFAENHLKNFFEKNILDYSKLRNFDYGPQNRNNISLLSPYISHRVLFEFNVVKDVFIVLPKVELKALSTTWLYFQVVLIPANSLILSKITTVSFNEYPTTVKMAAIKDCPISMSKGMKL